MKINVLKESPSELKIEIEGENHTYCNALQKVLLEDDSVEMAGYNLPHPLTSSPIVYVRTRGNRKPAAALKDAAKKLGDRSKEFRKTFEKALKEWRRG
jgi:DNA-directed RNA polymerase subunit L